MPAKHNGKDKVHQAIDAAVTRYNVPGYNQSTPRKDRLERDRRLKRLMLAEYMDNPNNILREDV